MNPNFPNIGTIVEYENLLVDDSKKNLNTIEHSSKSNAAATKDMLRYIFENLLNWSHSDVNRKLSKEIIDKMKIGRAIKNLGFPDELDSETDLWYVACVLYPEEFTYDADMQFIKVYINVLEGRIPRFPKWFFSEYRGEMNTALCLNYALRTFKPFMDIEDLYRYFSTSSVNSFLNEIKLLQPCEMFFSSPLEMLHESLGTDERNEFLYNYYQVCMKVESAGLPSELVPVYREVPEFLEFEQQWNGFARAFNMAYKQITV